MATRTIANGGGNWNATTTWVEGAVPVLGDAVVATATSGQLTVNITTAACTSVDFTNYTNTFTISSGQQLAVSGTFKFVAGMSVAGTGTLRFNATATITSAGLTWTGNLHFGGLSQTYTLGDNWSISGTLSAVGTTGVDIVGAFTLTVANGYSIGGGLPALRLGSTTTLKITGGTINTSSNIIQGNTISTTAILDLAGNVTVTTLAVRYLTLTNSTGTITATTLSLGVGGLQAPSVVLNVPNINWANITTSNTTQNCAITLSADLYTTNFTFTSLTSATMTFSGAFNINVKGNLSIGAASSTAIVTGATFIMNGTTGTQTITTVSTSQLRSNLTINSTATSVTFSGTVYYNTGTLTYTAGTVTTTNSTLNIGTSTTLNVTGITWNNITVVAGTLTLTSGSILTLSGILTSIGTAASNITIKSSSAGNAAMLTLLNNGVATQSIAHITATDINSSNGQTIWNYKGTLSNTQNWKLLTSATRNPTIAF